MPGFSFKYLGYLGPGKSAGTMIILLPNLNSEAISKMQCVDLIKQCQNYSIAQSGLGLATPKVGIGKWDS